LRGDTVESGAIDEDLAAHLLGELDNLGGEDGAAVVCADKLFRRRWPCGCAPMLRADLWRKSAYGLPPFVATRMCVLSRYSFCAATLDTDVVDEAGPAHLAEDASKDLDELVLRDGIEASSDIDLNKVEALLAAVVRSAMGRRSTPGTAYR
jgi:hypothetical protein